MAAHSAPGTPSPGDDSDFKGCAWRTRPVSLSGSPSSDYYAPERATEDSSDDRQMIQILEARLDEVQGKLARMEALLHRTFCRVEITEDFLSWMIEWIEAQEPDKLAGTLSRLRSGCQPATPTSDDGGATLDVRMADPAPAP